MKLVVDRELTYDSDLYDVVLVGMSLRWCISGLFQWRMAIKYPEIIELDRSEGYNDHRRMGTRLTLPGNPTISLMYYHVKRSASIQQCSVSYIDLERCLTTANAEFKGQKVATLIAGSTPYDGKGDREKCLDLLEKCLKDVDLYVYDYEIKNTLAERDEAKKFLTNLRKTKPSAAILKKYTNMGVEGITKLMQQAKEKKQREKELTFIEI